MTEKYKKNWFMVPFALIEDEKLTPTDAIIYGLMLNYADNCTLTVKISQNWIAKKIGIGRSSVIRALDRLEQNSYIQKVEFKKEQKGEARYYKLFRIIEENNKKDKPKPKQQEHSYDLDDLKSLVNNFGDKL